MYADDLILMSPSVTVLQKLFNIVEDELTTLDMSINPRVFSTFPAATGGSGNLPPYSKSDFICDRR